MGWREELQRGKYNGVEFAFESAEGSFGRRVQVHQYPGRDIPWAEDLGKKARELSLSAFFVGENYMVARDAFIAEVEKSGPGTLVHPTMGVMRVSIVECRVRESSREGGMATVDIRFVEAGEKKFPSVRADTVNKSSLAVDDVLVSLTDDFSDRVSVTSQPGFVLDEVNALLQESLGWINSINGRINARTSVVSSIAASIRAVTDSATTLLQTPHALAGEVGSVIGSVFSSFLSVDDVISSYDSIDENINAWPSVGETTPARQQQAINQSAMATFIGGVVLVETVRTVVNLSDRYDVSANSDSPFDSYQHAIAVRDQLLDAMEAMALATNNDDLFRTLVDLQNELIAHIAAHGARLVRVETLTLVVEEPSLVVTWRKYGAIDLDADLLRRNNIRHPGFMLAGVELEVLANG